MKAPDGTTIIATPLANCWLEPSIMCVDNVNCDRTAGNAQMHYRILESIVGGKKFCWLKKFPTCTEFDESVRRLAASVLPRMCGALAIVTPPDASNALSRSYHELERKGIPLGIFSDEQEARQWLEKQICNS